MKNKYSFCLMIDVEADDLGAAYGTLIGKLEKCGPDLSYETCDDVFENGSRIDSCKFRTAARKYWDKRDGN